MSIGLELKQARENKGASLQEVSARIKIQAKFLEALENDDFASLPSSLYAKGFLKAYAQFLNLNQDDLVSKLDGSEFIDEKQVIILPNKELPPVRHKSYFKKAIFVIIGACLAAGLILFFISLFHSEQPRQPKKKPDVIKPKQKNNKKQPTPVLKQAEAKLAPAAPAQAAVNTPLNLTVIAKRPCHLSVKADGMLLYEGFLLAGAADQWQAKKSFNLSLSDGSAVELVVNGKKFTQSAQGQRKDIIITKDGIKRSATP